jgi:hypothetical protein
MPEKKDIFKYAWGLNKHPVLVNILTYKLTVEFHSYHNDTGLNHNNIRHLYDPKSEY